MELLGKERVVMEDMMTLSEAERYLGVTRKTLLKHIRRAGIQTHSDIHDLRKKMLDQDQIAVLEDIVRRISRKRVSGGTHE